MRLEGDLMEIAKRQDEGKWDARSQRGEAIELTLDMLNANERTVLETLALADGGVAAPMKIAEIMLANQWQIPDKSKGNSRVRNSLRKLVRGQWVEHTSKFGDGRYQVTGLGRSKLNPEPDRNPIELSHAKVVAMRFDMSSIDSARRDRIDNVKRADCGFYNSCLEQAVQGNWSGFSCKNCHAYQEMSRDQKEADHVRLRAVQMASDMIEKYGNAGRIRGVKPGPDAKRTVRETVQEETVPLIVALKVLD